jgi:dihydropteroate synthase
MKVMGVVNVTDDSFSDGGLFLDRDRAVEHGLALTAQGAAIIDVGGESTRPGATRIDASVETARVLPVIKSLAEQGITVSIDTMHAEVARAALENGASIVNDVSGGLADPGMAPLLADARVPWVLMHWRSVGAQRPHRAPEYTDVVVDVRTELLRCVDAAVAAGVDPRTRNTTGRCCGRCHNSSPPASRCSSARRASASSERCLPNPTARHGIRRAGRPPPR